MQALFEDLTSVDEGKAAAAWRFFFFNEDAVVSFLKSSPIDQVQQVIAAGAGWGSGLGRHGLGYDESGKGGQKTDGRRHGHYPVPTIPEQFSVQPQHVCRVGNPCG